MVRGGVSAGVRAARARPSPRPHPRAPADCAGAARHVKQSL